MPLGAVALADIVSVEVPEPVTVAGLNDAVVALRQPAYAELHAGSE